METEKVLPLPEDAEEWEGEQEEAAILMIEQNPDEMPPIPLIALPTVAHAERGLKRVAFLRRQRAAIEEVFDAEEAALQAELARVQARKAKAIATYLRRESWYEHALYDFGKVQLAVDPKVKTIRLPSGELTFRNRQPEWQYGSEERILGVIKVGCPELISRLIRTKEEVVKNELKKLATVKYSTVFLTNEDGERIELPIAVIDRDPAMKIVTE